MKRNFSIVFLAFLLAVTVSCKKKEEVKANASLDSNTGLKNNGSFIKGDVTTTDENGNPVTFSFDYMYEEYDMSYDAGTGNSGTLGGEYLYRNFTDRENSYPNRASFSVQLDSLEDQEPNETTLQLRLESTPIIGANGELFYFAFYGDAANTEIDNYVYDATTNTASGTFKVTGSTATNNGNEANITGSFSFKNIKYLKF